MSRKLLAHLCKARLAAGREVQAQPLSVAEQRLRPRPRRSARGISASRRHLGGISAASRRHLGGIFAASSPHLRRIFAASFAASRPHLGAHLASVPGRAPSARRTPCPRSPLPWSPRPARRRHPRPCPRARAPSRWSAWGDMRRDGERGGEMGHTACLEPPCEFPGCATTTTTTT